MTRSAWLLLFAAAAPAVAQTEVRPTRMEIVVERREANTWRAVDPSLVLASGERVRFRFRSNFNGFLYVMNHSSSGSYEQLFPHEESGRDNRIEAGREYLVPATKTAFRITGPPGYETLYWMVSPAEMGRPAYKPLPPPPTSPDAPKNMTPRCDDAIFRARGECLDRSAGAKMVPRGASLPENLAGVEKERRDLVFVRQKNTSVVSSQAPLNGPVIYEFRLAHK